MTTFEVFFPYDCPMARWQAARDFWSSQLKGKTWWGVWIGIYRGYDATLQQFRFAVHLTVVWSD